MSNFLSQRLMPAALAGTLAFSACGGNEAQLQAAQDTEDQFLEDMLVGESVSVLPGVLVFNGREVNVHHTPTRANINNSAGMLSNQEFMLLDQERVAFVRPFIYEVEEPEDDEPAFWAGSFLLDEKGHPTGDVVWVALTEETLENAEYLRRPVEGNLTGLLICDDEIHGLHEVEIEDQSADGIPLISTDLEDEKEVGIIVGTTEDEISLELSAANEFYDVDFVPARIDTDC